MHTAALHEEPEMAVEAQASAALSAARSPALSPAGSPDVSDAAGHGAWPRLLAWIWWACVASFVLTLVVAWLEFRAGWAQPDFAMLQAPYFGDLLEYVPTFRLVHTPAFFQHVRTSAVAYPPFGAAVFAMLYKTGDAVRAFLLVALVGVCGAIGALRRKLVAYGLRPRLASPFLMTLALTSFPLWRLIPQGNIELFLVIFTAVGIWAYLRGYDDAAAVLWGLAAAMKLFPIVLLVLFVPRRNVRALLVGVGTFVGATVASLRYLGPTIAIAWRGTLTNVFGYQGLRDGEWTKRELVSNHSWYTLSKVVVAKVAGGAPGTLAKPYYVCGAVLFAVVFFGRVRRMPVANQLVVVCLFMLLMPPVSYFHPLTNLYAPWFVLLFLAIRAERAKVHVPWLHATILLFLPLFWSFTLYSDPKLSIYGALVQCCLMTVLFVVGVAFPFAEPASEAAIT